MSNNNTFNKLMKMKIIYLIEEVECAHVRQTQGYKSFPFFLRNR